MKKIKKNYCVIFEIIWGFSQRPVTANSFKNAFDKARFDGIFIKIKDIISVEIIKL